MSKPNEPKPVYAPLTKEMLAQLPRQFLFQIKGLGHVPNFKNSKQLLSFPRPGSLRCSKCGLRPTRPASVTDKDYQKVMDEITESIVLQFISIIRTTFTGTLTAEQVRSWIAYAMPEDDSWNYIPDMVVRNKLVEVGCEGADIILERLPDQPETEAPARQPELL